MTNLAIRPTNFQGGASCEFCRRPLFRATPEVQLCDECAAYFDDNKLFRFRHICFLCNENSVHSESAPARGAAPDWADARMPHGFDDGVPYFRSGDLVLECDECAFCHACWTPRSTWATLEEDLPPWSRSLELEAPWLYVGLAPPAWLYLMSGPRELVQEAKGFHPCCVPEEIGVALRERWEAFPRLPCAGCGTTEGSDPVRALTDRPGYLCKACIEARRFLLLCSKGCLYEPPANFGEIAAAVGSFLDLSEPSEIAEGRAIHDVGRFQIDKECGHSCPVWGVAWAPPRTGIGDATKWLGACALCGHRGLIVQGKKTRLCAVCAKTWHEGGLFVLSSRCPQCLTETFSFRDVGGAPEGRDPSSPDGLHRDAPFFEVPALQPCRDCTAQEMKSAPATAEVRSQWWRRLLRVAGL